MEQHTITGHGLSATIRTRGAELCRLQANGEDFLWPASPPWQRHAPVLFPIVGRLANDTLRHAGATYRMTQHGFARDCPFTWLQTDPTVCRLALTDDATTRALYPFAFRLDITYAIAANGLTITYRITNPGDAPLPASIGAHPGFAWPLRPGLPKESHTLTFEADEPAPIRGVSAGLLTKETRPSPIQGNTLALTPALFAADALILEAPNSRRVRYTAPGAPALDLSWTGFQQLGIWSLRDANLLCLEPWFGTASPADFDGDFADKPGLAILEPGGCREFSHRIAISEGKQGVLDRK
jgi:galactose mutarotase-like enzyme